MEKQAGGFVSALPQLPITYTNLVMDCGWVEVGVIYLLKVFVKGGSKHPHYQADCNTVASKQFGFEYWLASTCAVLKLDVATPAEHGVLFVAWIGFAILVGRHFV